MWSCFAHLHRLETTFDDKQHSKPGFHFLGGMTKWGLGVREMLSRYGILKLLQTQCSLYESPHANPQAKILLVSQGKT